jgi:hypothetical protein
VTRIVIVGTIIALAACATHTEEAPPKAPVAPVVVDSFCATAKKRAWSVKDSPETIKEALAWNRAVDRRCPPAKTAKKG